MIDCSRKSLSFYSVANTTKIFNLNKGIADLNHNYYIVDFLTQQTAINYVLLNKPT